MINRRSATRSYSSVYDKRGYKVCRDRRGEYHSRQNVLSSIQNRLGLHDATTQIRDGKARGIAELMVEVRENYAMTLVYPLLLEI